MGQESCEQMYREDEYMTCRLQDIQPGVIIKTQSWCCNEKFCGEKETKELATMPAPVFSGSISVKDTTNTSITITLPQIIKEGDGTSNCFILVEHVIQDGERVHDLQAEAKMLIGRDKRNQRYKGDGPVWIAGNISRTTQQFEVGDGEEYGGFMNHPLEEGEEYFLGLLCATKLLGMWFLWTSILFIDITYKFTYILTQLTIFNRPFNIMISVRVPDKRAHQRFHTTYPSMPYMKFL
ncbi:uncharacterized protein LOC135217578 [Macrobrachium nipponense]|uniref:uncharacterized protein LOC135217578 n=1 Tax=Macrobrachium nipponense TaxID=159736 RepID=UPI0030C7FE14